MEVGVNQVLNGFNLFLTKEKKKKKKMIFLLVRWVKEGKRGVKGAEVDVGAII